MPHNEFERRFLPAEEVRFQVGEEDRPKIWGYAIVFNKWSEIISENGIRFRERITPDSVRDALADGADIRALVNHDPDKLLARTRSGTLTYRIDEVGVYVEIDPPNTSYARDALESIRRGDMSGASFSYRTAKGGDAWDLGGDVPARTVNRIESIREFSTVAFPAYPDTEVAVRSLQEELEAAAPADLELYRLRLALADN